MRIFVLRFIVYAYINIRFRSRYVYILYYLDIDECALNACGVDANCTNTDGSFTCHCPAGYKGDARVHCYSEYNTYRIILTVKNI